MEKRNQSIDFTRSIAIVMIVTCHFLLFGGIEGLSPLGRHFAYVGNFIFFAISALLFGFRYAYKGAVAFSPVPFMKKRLLRLFSSLWPFLIVILAIYAIIGVSLNPVKVAVNFAGLGWFGKLQNIGHLWFVTQIILCYLMYVVVSNVLNCSKLNRGWAMVVGNSCRMRTIAIYT